MKEIYQKPFENVKKISLDVNKEILEIIDDLAKLTKTNRTVVIGAIIGKGISPFFRYLKENWEGLLTKEDLDEKKKKMVKDTLKGLKKIEITKWDPQAYK